MAFSIVAVLRQSFRRLATGPALLILLTLALVQWITTLVPGQFIRATPALIQSGAGVPPVVFTGNLLPLVALVVVAVITMYLSLVTIRVFAGQWGIVEREHLTHRVGFGLLNLFGVFVFVAIVAIIGLAVLGGLLGPIGVLLWIVLFLVFAAAAFFAPAFVAVEDDNVLTAFRKSGRVLAQNPLTVAALLIALAVVNVVLQAIGGIVIDALGSFFLLELLVSTVIAALGSVFLWITVARAYDHLGVESV